MLCLLERGGRLTHRNLEFSFGFLFLFSFFSFRRLVLNVTVNDCNYIINVEKLYQRGDMSRYTRTGRGKVISKDYIGEMWWWCTGSEISDGNRDPPDASCTTKGKKHEDDRVQ